jgi:hypothetical protein
VDTVSISSGSALFNTIALVMDSVAGVDLDGAGGEDDVTLVGGALVALSSTQDFGALNLSGTSRMTLIAGGGKRIVLRTLSITESGTLDLADNSLVMRVISGQTQSALEQLNALAARGRTAAGSWSGTGIASGNAANFPGRTTGLTVAPNLLVTGVKIAGYEAFDTGDVIVGYTWNGDINLDRRVDIDDYLAIDSSFLQGLSGPGKQHLGDFNFDTVINIDDYLLIDNAFLGQVI